MSAAEALAPERSVDEVRESLSVTEKGQPANTIGNCRTVFCHDPLLRGAIRLNLLTDRVDIVQDLGWRRNTSALTDTDVKYLLLYFEQNYGLTSEKKMTAALSIVANENCYHPIQDVLNGLVWDGTPRIRSCLHHFLGAEVSDYVEEMLKHFLLGAIRRVFSPGSKYEEMLCLVGGQGASAPDGGRSAPRPKSRWPPARAARNTARCMRRDCPAPGRSVRSKQWAGTARAAAAAEALRTVCRSHRRGNHPDGRSSQTARPDRRRRCSQW